MRVTYNWLKTFVDIDVTPEVLAEKLTSAGMEVEEIIYQNEHLHDVVVGKILKIERHPQADRLVVCQVDIGSKIVQIITSATNVFEGAVIPVSLPGADLVNGVKIQPSVMRGVDSYGMFCSGEEIGIDENYFEGGGVNGILILPNSFKVGTPIDKALMLDDVIYEVNVTPNRPDCMSVIGIAREVCAILKKPLKEEWKNIKVEIDSTQKVQDMLSVDVQTPNCTRYMACAVKDIKIERSPLEIRARLNAVGIKPINTIVDITNFVLIEQGQPLHAFDYNQIGGKKIVVRQAKNGESLECLNHNTYNLTSDEMVIADAQKPMVIAGIIGGTQSGIGDNTKTCIFESAAFDLKSIRITSKKIGVRTDSSARYSKGVNTASPKNGMARALALIEELGCGKVVSGVIDVCQNEIKERKVVGSVEKINKILGVKIDGNKMAEILNCLGIKCTLDGGKLFCQVPVFRDDIENEHDLAEEVIRLYGYSIYDNINYKLFQNSPVTEGKRLPKSVLEGKLKSTLVNLGFFEVLNYSLCSPSLPKKLLITDERAKLIKIANPISEDISCMRTCMADALLENIAYNLRASNKDLRFFECGKIYLADTLPLTDLPTEKDKLAFVVCEDGVDFYQIKGIVENLLIQTSLDYTIKRSSESYLHPGISADIYAKDGTKVGCYGKIHPLVAKNYDIPESTYYAEIDTTYLSSLADKKIAVKSVPKFPVVERDIAVIVDENKTTQELLDAIKSACGKLYYEASLFDVYRSESLGANKKSMAFNIKIVDNDKTLTEEEVAQVIKKVLKSLEFRFGAVLR